MIAEIAVRAGSPPETSIDLKRKCKPVSVAFKAPDEQAAAYCCCGPSGSPPPWSVSSGTISPPSGGPCLLGLPPALPSAGRAPHLDPLMAAPSHPLRPDLS